MYGEIIYLYTFVKCITFIEDKQEIFY